MSPAIASTSVRSASTARARLELVLRAGVDHEPPAALGERLGEREAEAARCAGDDRGAGHASVTRVRAERGGDGALVAEPEQFDDRFDVLGSAHASA